MNGLSLRISGNGDGKAGKKNNQSKLDIFGFSQDIQLKFSNVTNVTELFEAQSLNSQLEFLRNVSKLLQHSDDVDPSQNNRFISLLVNVFLHVPIKHPLKNTAARILTSNNQIISTIECELSKELTILIKNSSNKQISDLNNVNTVVNSCFENFNPGIGAVKNAAKNILPFLHKTLSLYIQNISDNSLKLSPTEKLELYTYIHNLNRVLLTLLQKCDVDFYSIESVDIWEHFSKHLLYLIQIDDLPIDTKILCAMNYILISDLRFGKNTWKFILEIIFNIDDHSNHMIHPEVSEINSNIEILCLCSSLLSIIDNDDIHNVTVDRIPILLFLSQKLFDLSERMSVDTTIIIGVARAMLSISRHLFKITDNVDMTINIIKIILSFIWSHLEYYVDSVRHLSTQILINIVKISVQLENQGNNEFSNEVFHSVMMLPSDRHSKYKGLATLSSEYGCQYLLDKYPSLVVDLLKAINSINVPANVSIAFETLICEHNKQVSIDILFNTWISPILNIITTFDNNSETAELSMNVLQDVLSKAIQLNPGLISLMIPAILNNDHFTNLSYGQLKCILICLHIARKSGCFDQIVDQSDCKWKNIIEYELLRSCTYHTCSSIRLLTLHLIVDSHKSTELYTPVEFELLKMFLSYNINIQSPSVRQNILSLTKKLLKRWKDGFDVVLRNIDNIKNKSSKLSQTSEQSFTEELIAEENVKNIYISFIKDAWNSMLDNIFPSANFSRRNISLQILVWCQEFIKSDSVSFTWHTKAITMLLEYLDDSYESNKQLTVSLLSHCPAEYLNFQDQVYMKSLLNDSISLASSVKPTDCVTAAYRLSLLTCFPKEFNSVLCNTSSPCGPPFENQYHVIELLMHKLTKEMKIAETNILLAASNGPMYGLIHCIHHILNRVDLKNIHKDLNWSSLLYNLVQMLFKVNEIVAPVVNNSSPEGHLPMDFNAGSNHIEGNGVILGDGKRVTAQMVLLCAWRSVKEVSLLLGDISYNAHVLESPTNDQCVSAKLIIDIGEHFTSLLSETKHRGAFEQAYLGFSKLCLRLWKSTIECLHSLPRLWLDELISAVSGDKVNSKLCATRRSAGVPFMVQALVTTELQVSGKPQSFHKCITTLLHLATFTQDRDSNTSVETRTHCLNILRALYRHTALGEHVNPYVAEGLMTAITGFDGSTWAERNSSTLLFSSLMTRIFGVQRSKDSESLCIRNKMTGRIFFLRYPQLYDFILKHLKEVSEQIDNKDFLKPSLYPILLLMARLYPSSLEGTDSNLKLVAYIPYLLDCAKCCVLKTRQLAAKAMVPLISHDRYFFHLTKLFEILSNENIKTNFCHGILLQLIRLLQNVPDNCSTPSNFHNDLYEYINKTKWILAKLYNGGSCFVTAESYLHMVYLCITKFNLEITSKSSELYEYLKCQNNVCTKVQFGFERFYVTRLHLLMQMAFDSQSIDEVFRVLHNHRESSVYETKSVALNYVLCLQNKANLQTICEQFEIGDIEKMFVSKLNTEVVQKILHLIYKSYTLEDVVKLMKKTNLECHRKQLMSFTYDKYLSKSFWITLLIDELSEDKRMLHFIDETSSEFNQQIDKFIYLRFINNHLKSINCSSIYKHYSQSSVNLLSRQMYETWSSLDNFVYMNLECVDFIKNHWLIFDWRTGFEDKKKVYPTILQWASLFQLLDNEEEDVRHNTSQAVCLISQLCMDSNSDVFPLCDSRGKEMLARLIMSWCKKTCWDLSLFVLIVLTFIDGSDTSTCKTDDEEYQVFDKEVVTYQEKVANVKLFAREMKNYMGETWTGKNNQEKIAYLCTIMESQSKDMCTSDEDICGDDHTTLCIFWHILRSMANVTQSHKEPLGAPSNDFTVYRIKTFLYELDVDVNSLNSDFVVENNTEHIYNFMNIEK